MPSREHPIPLSVGRAVAQPLNLVFGMSRPLQKKSAETGQKVFSYQRWIGSSSVDEENGERMYVKRNLTLLRLWGRRSCRSNYDRFDVATPKSLEIGKNSQHCQTNNDNQHQQRSGFRNARRFRFFSCRFWQIHTPVSE
jgi:hypothetical protein